ncbi:helix-turn-helix transcriptional regulator [Mammaliicoccus lentus]|uniref:helix-turn-helix transcriptional regulator n=1 Tax=Mammaliicoccus lentus TaxID=42858 RepID=UPI00374FC6A8
MNWITDRRKKLGLTQQEVADKSDIDRAYLSLIETGKRSPSVVVAKRLALTLQVDWTIFFDQQGNELKQPCN